MDGSLVADDYGLGNEDKIVREGRERLSAAWDHDRENRSEAQQDLNFLAGQQWPDTVRREREDDGRPVLTINRLPQFVRQVTNDIRQADVGIKVAPTDGAASQAEGVIDPKSPGMGHNGGPQMQAPTAKPLMMSEVYDGLIREIQYRSSATQCYAQAAEHQTSCGIGHFRILTQYVDDDSFDQEIRIEGMPFPLSVYWDPAAVRQDRSDAMWCIVTEQLPRDTFKAKYPKARDVDVEIADDLDSHSTDLTWTTVDTVRVAEYWCKKPVKKQIAQLDDGSIVEVPKGVKPDELGAVSVREVESFQVEQYIISGAEVLEGPTQWAGKHIPIIPVIGSEVPLEDKVLRYGLIRFARDPQQLYNFARTAAAESMGQAPKSPYLVTAAMIKPFKKVWDTASRKLTPYLPFEPDPKAPQGPQRLPAPDVPMAYVNEANVADGDIKSTVGMYDPQLGQRSNESSGKAIMAREQQGDTGTFHYSDNLRFALEFAGRQLVDLIPRIYDNERVIRIMGEDDAERYVPINKAIGYEDDGKTPVYINDLSVGRYDCRVKIGPSYATKRMESADSMMQFMQAFPQAAGLIGDLIAKNMDWPGSQAIAERLRNAVPAEVLGEDAPQQPPDPMAEDMQEHQQQMMLGTLKELQAKIDKLEADADKSEAEADKVRAETELLPLDRAIDAEKYDYDREDRQYEAEQSRAERLQQFSMRTQGANGAAPSQGEI